MAIILITGAEGQLGNELRIVSRNFYGYDFVFTDKGELDITDKKKVEEQIRSIKPNWLINCAAYNFVDKAESETEKTLLINGTAVMNIVDVIKGTDCRFIHLSSDYVYDGQSSVPYKEDVVPNPSTAYGRSKLAGEKYALNYPLSMIIRTSWLYSVYGHNFLKSMLKLGNEKKILMLFLTRPAHRPMLLTWRKPF
jgi:dTDP-4-dehydrorhamnose reductase